MFEKCIIFVKKLNLILGSVVLLPNNNMFKIQFYKETSLRQLWASPLDLSSASDPFAPLTVPLRPTASQLMANFLDGSHSRRIRPLTGLTTHAKTTVSMQHIKFIVYLKVPKHF